VSDQLVTSPSFLPQMITAESTTLAKPLDFFAHRSGHEAQQYCPRRRYLAYHHLGTGVNLFPPLYFDVGTAFHHISRFLLSDGDEDAMHECIAFSLDWFRSQPVYMGMKPDERSEQETLIAGMLWTFWYRVWPSFNARFEVLMAEPPSVDTREFEITAANAVVPAKLHLLSRPDVIVRDRQTHEIVAINWKTINSITDERRQNIAASLQVNLEAHYAEKLYSKWMDDEFVPDIPTGLRGKLLMQYLDEATAYYKSLPREVAYTQIIYFVKGTRQLVLASGQEVNAEEADRWTNEEKSWRQDSLLCYRWVNLTGGAATSKGRAGKGLDVTIPPVSWSARFYKKGNQSYNELTKDYARQGVWESGLSIQQHVCQLNDGAIFPSTLNPDDERNEANPLDRIVFFENPIYRDADMQTRLRRGVINREMDIAQALVRVQEATAAGELLDDVLDIEFPMQLISCRKPTRCEYDGRLCNVPSEKREKLFTILPVGGQWQARQPHHAAELEAFNADRA
jgi:hypothetical protein